MDKIASFKVDHTMLERGVYLSREDGDIKTWDVRMKTPNCGDYLGQKALHTLEHLLATKARNGAYGRGIIYVGPMGCRTGFYVLTRGLTDEEVLKCLRESFRYVAYCHSEIPGATLEECGNYEEHDLPAARTEALKYLKEVLMQIDERHMRYR